MSHPQRKPIERIRLHDDPKRYIYAAWRRQLASEFGMSVDQLNRLDPSHGTFERWQQVSALEADTGYVPFKWKKPPRRKR